MNEQGEATLYEIRVRGVLGDTVLVAFPMMDAQTSRGDTVLVGALPDQAALHGVLAGIEALGLELLEVRRQPHRAGQRTVGRSARARRAESA
jgi:hypothetical protein